MITASPWKAGAVSPLAIVFGQSYGGEASLRIILFSSPWCSALIACALVGARTLKRLRAALAAVAVAFAGLFVVSYLGLEELNLVSRSELNAAGWFYSHARPGSVLVLAAPGNPYRYGATYPLFRGPEGDANPNLMTERVFLGRPLGPAQVPAVAGRILIYSRHGYIAFSRDEITYAEVFRLTPPGALQSLRAAVAASPRFALWYANRDVQIYELVSPSPGRGVKTHPRTQRRGARPSSAHTPRVPQPARSRAPRPRHVHRPVPARTHGRGRAR